MPTPSIADWLMQFKDNQAEISAICAEISKATHNVDMDKVFTLTAQASALVTANNEIAERINQSYESLNASYQTVCDALNQIGKIAAKTAS